MAKGKSKGKGKGKGKPRQYNRDANGRFASGAGGGGKKPAAKPSPKPKPAAKPKAPLKTTTARGRARTAETRARAAVRAGGGTRATRSLLTAQRARDYYKATGTGTKRSKVRPARPARPRSAVRPTGGLKRPQPASNIRRTAGPRRAPLGRRVNAIRTYTPATPQGQMAKGLRRIGKGVRKMQEGKPKRRELLGRAEKLLRNIDRRTAREMTDAMRPGVIGDVARSVMRYVGSSSLAGARDVIRRRAARASAAAARGSAIGARASSIYANQLAFTGPGKPRRGAKNKIVPGPRNTQPPKPKRKRKPRKPRP